jgi:hypothetical protein
LILLAKFNQRWRYCGTADISDRGEVQEVGQYEAKNRADVDLSVLLIASLPISRTSRAGVLASAAGSVAPWPGRLMEPVDASTVRIMVTALRRPRGDDPG